MSKRISELRAQWATDLERIEDGYAEALEAGADLVRLSQMEGAIAAYRQIITDAAR